LQKSEVAMMGARNLTTMYNDPRCVEALAAVAEAGARVDAAKAVRSKAIKNIERELCEAVKAARELDIEWGRIAGALGIARGNAYQRYRPLLLTAVPPDAPPL
jgi:hypothetical protein